MKLIRSALGIAVVALVPLAAGAEQQPGFRYGDEVFQGESLPPALHQKLFELEANLNDQREQLFTQFAIEKYLADRAEAEGKSIEEVQAELLAPAPPDEAAIRKFYDENRDRIPAEYDNVKDQLAQYLQQQQMQERIAALVDRIRKEKGFEVMLPEADAPVFSVATEGYPAKGAADPEVTVVEFADFQCPYCKRATGAVENLLDEYGDRVRVVYRDFPINQSGISREIAEGGVCAAEQDRFWDYHDLAFERQDSLAADSPAALAAEAGLDEEAFAECLASDKTEMRVAESKAEAIELGVSGTPTFFVNGRQLHVDKNLEADLTEAVQEALADSS